MGGALALHTYMFTPIIEPPLSWPLHSKNNHVATEISPHFFALLSPSAVLSRDPAGDDG